VRRLEVKNVNIGVIGASKATKEELALAVEVGRLIARSGATLVCGGLGGVMEAAARGAAEEGGIAVGILPGNSLEDANRYLRVAIATGMGEARNVIIVKSCASLVAIGGGYGTLSEIATAMRLGVPVIGLLTWRVAGRDPDLVVRAVTAEEAVDKAVEIARVRPASRDA
jgi:uncharacterized protein (TIGR00725 family)